MKIILIKLNIKKVLLFIVLFIIFLYTLIAFYKNVASSEQMLHTFNSKQDAAPYSLESLEKENEMLKSLLTALIPKKQNIIVEDEYRNIFQNTGQNPPLPLAVSPLITVINKGADKDFRVLTNEPEYLRPIYDPSWKMSYYRGWIQLLHKNIEARHRIFAFSMGGSANFDIFGSLGLNLKNSPSAPLDNHRNINFLVYDFQVKSVKVFNNQVALVGEATQSGAQIVSIVQNDLLPQGVTTKDFIFQLTTKEGYEIDFLNYNIIQYEYLKKQIEENTVRPVTADEEAENKKIERLIRENEALKQELSYFLPAEDELINKRSCTDYVDNEDSKEKNNDKNVDSNSEGILENGSDLKNDSIDITYVMEQSKNVLFSFNYNNPKYKRPLYDPLWKTNYERMWCYIPDQIDSNMHRLHIIPQTKEQQYDFFGKYSFHEQFQTLGADQRGFLVYNFNVSKVVGYKNHFLFIGTPSRTGAQIITIKQSLLKGYKTYFAKLITPDNSEIDCKAFN